MTATLDPGASPPAGADGATDDAARDATTAAATDAAEATLRLLGTTSDPLLFSLTSAQIAALGWPVDASCALPITTHEDVTFFMRVPSMPN